ncbi:unnamed protein product [Parnassius mnemosyne]|uniref:Major facilitator superfamily (MFS) profile domain-containing protein n=1 Tax=Parnassius mnemosyne TaxID=213953 RepID=A0AAV1KRW8_9NEOP
MKGHAPPETRSVYPRNTGEVKTESKAVTDEANMGESVRASTVTTNTTFPTSSLGVSSTVPESNRVDGQVGGGEALEAALCQLGPFGPYQRYVLTLLCLPSLLSAMYSFNYVFVAEQVPFRCVVPECEGAGASFGNTSVQALLSPEPCHRYSPLTDAPTCLREDFHLNHTVKCDAFIYENQNTIYAEFGLACREWLRTLVGSVRNAALPLALLLTGYISDRWGRLTAFCIFSACAGVMGLIKSFSVNYQMYIALEFLEAALGYGFASAAYVMVVELARPSLRASFACATGVAYGVGGALLALAAHRLHRWRQLLLALHTPALLLPLYCLLLDDSVRWLHATARQDEAIAVLRKAAKWNRVTLNEETLKAIGARDNKQEEKNQVSWLALVKTRALVVKLAACGWCWAAAAFIYYGLTINSVALSGDKYINFALNMAMEIVASLLIMMALERFGRKKSILASFLVCGVACIAPFFISHVGTGLGLYFAGKLGATSAFNSLYVFSAELFPTGVRARALSAVSLLGRIGSVLAPQTPLLSRSVQALLYGGCALSAALALLLLPETRREPLPH